MTVSTTGAGPFGRARPARAGSLAPRGGRRAPTAAGRRAAAELITDAREVLERARTAPEVTARLALAQVAAVRACGAVLAVRARPALTGPGSVRARRQCSAWELLGRLAPELGEWATHLGTPVDLAALRVGEASPGRVADDRVRDAERFLVAVERVVGRARPPAQGG